MIENFFENNNLINYLEIYITLDSNKNSVNIDESNFNLIFNKLIKKNNYKYFKKEIYIENYLNNEFVYNKSENKYLIQSKSLINYKINNKFIINYFHKELLPIHIFPSTKDINNINYITKYIIKINNRIYLNFEIKKNEDKYYRSIYLNYNHSSNVDFNITKDIITQITDKIINIL